MKKEIREKLEGVLEKNLDRLKEDDLEDVDRKDLARETTDLLVVLNNDEEAAMKAEADRTRCELEREKTQTMATTEAKKSQFSWLRFGTDLIGCMVPMAFGAWVYGKFQTKLLKFEENGHLTTTAARQLPGIGLFGEKLPKGRK